jgi:hypothetical protein
MRIEKNPYYNKMNTKYKNKTVSSAVTMETLINLEDYCKSAKITKSEFIRQLIIDQLTWEGYQ